MKETALDFSILTVVSWERQVNGRTATKKITVRIYDMIHVAGVFSEDIAQIRPAYVWGKFDAPDGSQSGVIAHCMVNPKFSVDDLSIDILSRRFWEANGLTRFKLYEVRLNNRTTGGDYVADLLQSADLAPTEDMVRQFQRDRETALRAFDEGWIFARISQMRAGNA